MRPLLTRAFWLDAGERAAKSFAQTLLALLAGDGVNLLRVDWPTALGLAGTAALLSILTSVASVRVPPAGSASLVGAATLVDQAAGRHARAE